MPDGRYAEVMERDGFRCQASVYGFGSTVPCDGGLVVHHRRMRGAGGSADPTINDADNLVVLCGGPTGRDGHHGEVHDFPLRSYDCGLLVRRSSVVSSKIVPRPY